MTNSDLIDFQLVLCSIWGPTVIIIICLTIDYYFFATMILFKPKNMQIIGRKWTFWLKTTKMPKYAHSGPCWQAKFVHHIIFNGRFGFSTPKLHKKVNLLSNFRILILFWTEMRKSNMEKFITFLHHNPLVWTSNPTINFQFLRVSLVTDSF